MTVTNQRKSTARVYGVTKCHECHKPFLDGEAITTRSILGSHWRETSPGNFRSSEFRWDARLHQTCMDGIYAWIEQVRADDEAHRLAVIAAIKREAGLT